MSRTNNHEGTIDPRPREGQSAAGGPRSALGCEVPPTPLARRPVPDELHGVVTATRSPPASRQHPTTTTCASYTRLVRRPARPVFPNTSDFNLDLLVKVMPARSLSVLSKYPVGAGLELQTSCFPPHPHLGRRVPVASACGVSASCWANGGLRSDPVQRRQGARPEVRLGHLGSSLCTPSSHYLVPDP